MKKITTVFIFSILLFSLFNFIPSVNALNYSDVVGHWHLNSSSGIIAIDSSPNQYNGTLINMDNGNWLSGKLNNCLQFDGFNELVKFECGNFERNEPFSLECWFKTSINSYMVILGKIMGGSPYTGYQIGIENGKINWELLNSATNRAGIKTINTYNDNVFHHIIATYNGLSTTDGMEIYIDGLLVGTTVTFNALSNSILNTIDFQISGRNGITYPFNGKLDEVIIYNKELNQSEVDYRYNSGNGRENIGESLPNSNNINSNEIPTNNSYDISVNLPYLKVDLACTHGSFNWSIETSPNIGNASAINETNNTKYCYIDNLEYDTKYTWFVNITDGNCTYSYIHYFFTESESEYTTEHKINETQWTLILTIFIFIFFFYMGYKSDKPSGGFLLIISGFTMFYLQTILPLSPVFVLPILSIFSIYIILIGIYKWLYDEGVKNE